MNLRIWCAFLGEQWLRHHASNAGGKGSNSGWGTKIPHASQCSQKQNNKNKQEMEAEGKIRLFAEYIKYSNEGLLI